ncbi:DUF4349 domain-containing protein [Paenibacillus sepulcri]|uniref:DUF4349 domain-containing protein n=1 Tax=Paenibacillus sepulcri TaxID=359917 RepID=A0ABS7C707_9BACL|nr:DUF4349 domain-containing protein [Paenibacillus sepulcri]
MNMVNTVKLRRKGLKLYITAVISAILLIAAGCSSSSSNTDSGNSGNRQTSNASSMQNQSAQSSEAATEQAVPAADSGMSANTASGTPVNNTAEAETGMSTGPDIDADGFSRKLIYHANITMEVSDYGQSQTELKNIIHLSGGYILEFGDQKSANELGGTYTIKVPASGFQSFLSQLEKLKHLDYQSSMKGTDVTEEYVDLEARLKSRQVVEARLIAFMDKATQADDLLKYSNQLSEVQLEIERIKGRTRYLDQNVSFSTIELRMYQNAGFSDSSQQAKPPLLDRSLDAMKASTSFINHFVQGLFVVIAGALPIIAIALVIGVPGYFIYRRKSRSRRHPVEAGGIKLNETEEQEKQD